MSTAPILDVVDLHVSYGVVRALAGVSVRVDAGACVAVIGPNGAGKTTLVRAIAGLLNPVSGTIRFMGDDAGRWPTEERARRGISVVPEGRGLLGTLTVEENLLLGGYARQDSLAPDLQRVYELLPMLAGRRTRRAQFLSGGELQLLALGRALMARPKILLLDEPSMGLAPLARDNVLRVLLEFKRSGLAMLLIEQNVYLALELADTVQKLDVGKVTYQGPPGRLRDPETIKNLYLEGA